MIKIKITLELYEITYELLRVLDEKGDVQVVLSELADHAQQGVYRPGSWERGWVTQAFGDEWTSKLESGDPYERHGQRGHSSADCALCSIFDRPKGWGSK